MQNIYLFFLIASIPFLCHVSTALSIHPYPDALEEAILHQESLDTIEAIAESIENINVLDPSGTPLLSKILHKKTSLESISLVLDAGANPNLTTTNGLSPLFFALKRNVAPQIVELLLTKGADANSPAFKHPGLENRGKISPLKLALRCKAPVEIVSALLEAGANLAEVDQWGDPLPIQALQNNASDRVVELLLEKSPPVDVTKLGYSDSKFREKIVTLQKRIAAKKLDHS